MGFGWRKKRISKSKSHHDKPEPTISINGESSLIIPTHFRCPISLDLMSDPVTLSSGISYDRDGIETWLKAGNFTCPVTNQVLMSFDLVPNHALRRMIQDWCVQNLRFGIERIPTPRVPISGDEIAAVLVRLESAGKRLEEYECRECLRKICSWGNDSERNRISIVSNGGAAVLAAAFDGFARDSIEKRAVVLEELLSSMSWMFTMTSRGGGGGGGGGEAAAARDRLASPESVKALLWFLKSNGNRIAAKQNSLIALKELLVSSSSSSNRGRVAESMLEIEDLHQILFGFLRSPFSPAITKLSLTLIFQLLQNSASKSGDRFKSSLIEADSVSFLLEMIISSPKERSVSEKAVGILDKLCDDPRGRTAASGNSLTVPLLVKKILRISAAATEFSVSVIWKLGRCDQKALVEGLQVGAFQKLVLVLQLGCGEETKEKATAVLKMMNPYRTEFECTESLDFKNLKRSF